MAALLEELEVVAELMLDVEDVSVDEVCEVWVVVATTMGEDLDNAWLDESAA